MLFRSGDIDDVRIYNRVLSTAERRVLAGYHPMQVSTWNVTPASSGMKLHYVPEHLGPLADNTEITQWDNTSGNPLHVVRGALGPLYAQSGINGRPALSFTAGRYLTRGCNDLNLGGDNLTIIGAISQTGNGGSNRALYEYGPNLVYLHDTSSQRLAYFNTSIRVNSQADFINLVAPNANMIYAVSNGASGGIYKNGTNVTEGAPVASTGSACVFPNALYLGSRFDGAVAYDSFLGLFGDVLYFNTVLIPADRRIAECYLSSKYSIPLGPGVTCD